MRISLVIFTIIILSCLLSCSQRPPLPHTVANSFPKRWVNSVGMEMVLIPGGTFTMGVGDEPPQGPAHQVTLTRQFYIGRYSLSKGEYRKFRDETGIDYKEFYVDPDQPPVDLKTVITFPWKGMYQGAPGDAYFLPRGPHHIAVAFAEWLSKREGRKYRLPTEAEWQWAESGGNRPRIMEFTGGSILNNCEMVPFDGEGRPGGYACNFFGLGATGWEWSGDKYGNFSSSSQIDPTGAWFGSNFVYCEGRSSRSSREPDYPGYYRFVCEIDENFLPPSLPKRDPPPPPVVRSFETMQLDCGNGITLEMRHLPAGDVLLGRPRSPYGPETKEWPQTQVKIPRDFWLGTYEVTQKQFSAVTGYNPSHFKGDDHPVEFLVWSNVLDFLGKINAQERTAGRLADNEEYRLPTEAEWEYACRAGTTTEYPFGNDSADLPWFSVYDQYDVGTSPVGTKYPNPWGFHDMLGNVIEMTWENFRGYPGKSVIDPFQHDMSRSGGCAGWAAARGGSWNMGFLACRPTWRRGVNVNARAYHIGIRLVRGQIIKMLDMPQGWKYTPTSSSSATIR